MQMTIDRLKQIIQEEVNAHIMQEKLTDKEEEKKVALEDELEDLEHQ